MMCPSQKKKLLPGHSLTYDPKSGLATEPRAYWTLPTAVRSDSVSADAAAEELRSLIDESVSDQMIADVPLGFFLSGGVDSSVAAVLIHEAIGDQLTCVYVDHGLMRAGESEQVVSIEPNRDHVASKGYACIKGLKNGSGQERCPIRMTRQLHFYRRWAGWLPLESNGR